MSSRPVAPQRQGPAGQSRWRLSLGLAASAQRHPMSLTAHPASHGGTRRRPWPYALRAILPSTRLRGHSDGLSRGASEGKSSLSFGTYLWCPLFTGSGAPACSLATASPVESSHPHICCISIIPIRGECASWMTRDDCRHGQIAPVVTECLGENAFLPRALQEL